MASSSSSLLQILLVLLTVSTTQAFLPVPSSARQRSFALYSTLAPTRPGIGLEGHDDNSDNDDDDDIEHNNVGVVDMKKALARLRMAMKKEETPSPKMMKRGAISMTIDELAVELGGLGRAQLAWDCYSNGVDPALLFGSVIRLGCDDFETVSSLIPTPRRSQTMGTIALEKLAQTYGGSNNNQNGRLEGGVASLSHLSTSHDRTTKLLLKLSDGLEVETVIIPWNNSRSTLCISSQVGCRQGCTFCATGKMGLLRRLTCDEILAQMFFAVKLCRLNSLPPITNVVFMGMGDSCDNAEAVNQAVKILTTRTLFQLSAQKVTVSTVAPTPDAFLQFAKSPCILAWSVHAANDALRRKLVPTTKYSMVELRQGLINALLQRPMSQRTSMLEVALMKGVNDSEKEADELATFALGIVEAVPGCKLIVNLIPYNDINAEKKHSGVGNIITSALYSNKKTNEKEEVVNGAFKQAYYAKPSQEAVVAFQKRLWAQGICAHVRATRGDDASAACGQLATKKRRDNNNNKDDNSMLAP